MRRFLHDVFKPSNALGKRARQSEGDALASPLKQPTDKNCLALQNEDFEEDAVVITALNVMPFCCHADLLTMSRDQLISVADALNLKLPHALRIDTSGQDSFIRGSIEVLVGIRKDNPATPRTKRSLSTAFSSSGDFADTSSNSFVSNNSVSPLALRNRTNNSYLNDSGTPRRILASLREEEEGPEPSDRPQKRRRTIAASPIPTPVQRERMVARSQSQRPGPLRPRLSAAPSGAAGVFRSQSQRLPDRKFERTFRNVTTARGRGRAMSQSAILTSTPKARQSSRVPEKVPTQDTDFSTSMTTSSSTSTILDLASGRRGLRSRLDYSGCQSSDEAPEVTSGLKDMAMGSDASGSGSDMDLTLE